MRTFPKDFPNSPVDPTDPLACEHCIAKEVLELSPDDPVFGAWPKRSSDSPMFVRGALPGGHSQPLSD